MTIKEAWENWSNLPENKIRAGKNRAAFASVILAFHGDVDLSEIDTEKAKALIAAHPAPREFHVKSASILRSLLWFGFYRNQCKSPQFEYDDILPEQKPEPPAPPHPMNHPSMPVPEALDIVGINKADKAKPKAKAKRTGGRPSTPICKIDPETLKVVKTFESQKAACESVGTDISKAVSRGYKSSGFYWCKKSNAKAFIRILEAKKLNAEAKKPEVRQQHLAKIKEERETAVANARQQFEEEVVNTVADILTKATDEELLTEIRRRGWQGSITISKQIEI